ncbi:MULTISPECIES: DUF6723 family protein [unclassified Caballeronia]|uniref:DUF6723 family protein n=1 Tax=unclassified Caballeronia TaxID=2646786 RepID=UPI002856A8B7|nr:hypothetical protein [Caballeronia sp. LZ024]MDR5841755.1 hypothetical protein [Caballeronia sp. LZ031]
MPGKRPKLVLYPTRTVTQPAPARTDDDFAIYTSYRINAGHLYHGSLKVVRKTDGRLLFPFDGAPVIGPFASKHEAITAAQERGRAIVLADLESPEGL